MDDCFEIRAAKERLFKGDSPIEGFGVFTRMGFRRGELITIMQGERIPIPELKNRYRMSVERITDPLQVSERFYLDMYAPFVQVNHSCDPNTAIVGKADMIALRDIDRGEELTFDYSLTEWTWERFGEYYEWEMKCDCGAPSCRGIVTQFPFLPLGLKTQAFKRGTLPDFMFRKIVKAGLAYNGR
jgi:hypothetical protein